MDRHLKSQMNEYIRKYVKKIKEPLRMLDIGSYDINGSFKTLTRDNWTYTGIDINDGPNVDIVMPDPYTIPMSDESVDLVISGSTFSYVLDPFELMKEVHRVLTPEGIVIVEFGTVFTPGILGIPPDCPVQSNDTFRYYPDGVKSIFQRAGLAIIWAELISDHKGKEHCWGVAEKWVRD